MEFGIFDHVDRGTASLTEFYEDRLKLVEKYDQVGFRSYHTAEHHATTLGMASSPSVYLSAVAQRTKRLRFGPLVYCLPQYHPIRLYEEICMLDQMSGGRLELGVGKGISPFESKYYGLDAEEVTNIYQEYYRFLMEAFDSDELTFEGNHFSVDKLPIEIKSVQQSHPPIWNGFGNPKAAAWPAENSINVITNGNAQRTRAMTDAYREEWDKLGRNPDDLPLMGMTRYIVIADTEKEALDIGRRIYPTWYNSFMKLWWRFEREPVGVSYAPEFEGAIDAGIAVAGTADQVKELLDQHIEESGINYFVARFAFGDITFEEAAYSIDAFAEMYLSE